jgi:hypothetical protein
MLKAIALLFASLLFILNAIAAEEVGNTVQVGVVVPDPDRVSNCLARLSANPTMAERGQCLREGLVGKHEVIVDGLQLRGISDETGALIINVPENSSIRFIFPGDRLYAPTLGNESYAVGNTALTGIPAHAMGKYEGATTPAVAAAANTTTETLIRQGLCIVDVLKVHAPPDIENAEDVTLTIDEGGYDIYAVGRFTVAGPSNVTKSKIAAAGRFAITKVGLKGETIVHIQASAGGAAFPPTSCILRPGFVTFAPYGM